MVFWTNFAFFGRKVKKVPCIIGAISRKSTFWEFLVLKQTGLLGKKVKKVLDIQAHFEEKITFFVRKVNKLQGIQPFFNGFLDKFCQFHLFFEDSVAFFWKNTVFLCSKTRNAYIICSNHTIVL